MKVLISYCIIRNSDFFYHKINALVSMQPLSLNPYVPYAWQALGRDGTVGLPASRSKRINLINLLGFMNFTGDKLTAFEHEGSVNSDVIIDIMDEFCKPLERPAVVVLDNASIHNSKAVAAKRETWERQGLTLYFLSTYFAGT